MSPSTDQFQRSGQATPTAERPNPIEYVQAEVGAEVTGEIVTSREKLEAIRDEQKEKLDPIVAGARAMTVTNATEERDAIEALNDIKVSLKTVENERKKIVNPINAAKEAAQSLFNGLKAPLEEARDILKPKVIVYQEAEERRVAAENAQREREAREKRAAEQARIDAEKAEALAASRAAEAKAREASEAMAAAKDAQAQADAQKAALEAAEAARAAEAELAAKREERPEFELAEREEVAATVHTSNGKATRKKVWEWTLVDRSQLPDEYLIVDDKKLNAVVKAGIRDIPGVKIEQVSKLAV